MRVAAPYQNIPGARSAGEGIPTPERGNEMKPGEAGLVWRRRV